MRKRKVLIPFPFWNKVVCTLLLHIFFLSLHVPATSALSCSAQLSGKGCWGCQKLLGFVFKPAWRRSCRWFFYQSCLFPWKREPHFLPWLIWNGTSTGCLFQNCGKTLTWFSIEMNWRTLIPLHVHRFLWNSSYCKAFLFDCMCCLLSIVCTRKPEAPDQCCHPLYSPRPLEDSIWMLEKRFWPKALIQKINWLSRIRWHDWEWIILITWPLLICFKLVQWWKRIHWNKAWNMRTPYFPKQNTIWWVAQCRCIYSSSSWQPQNSIRKWQMAVLAS